MTAVVRYDAIVPASAEWAARRFYISRDGARVIGLGSSASRTSGSSHGLSRIIRLAHWEHPDYVPLVRRAYDLGAIRADGGRAAARRHRQHRRGPPAQPHDSRIAVRLAHARLLHELLDASALARRFPGFRLPDDLVAVFQPDGGFLLPSAARSRTPTRRVRFGADVHTDERVLDWTAAAGEVQVVTTAAGIGLRVWSSPPALAARRRSSARATLDR